MNSVISATSVLNKPVTTPLTIDSAKPVFVNRHANGGVHADGFEGIDFTAGLNSTCGDNGVICCGAEFAEPVEIGAGHCAFAVHVGAEEG